MWDRDTVKTRLQATLDPNTAPVDYTQIWFDMRPYSQGLRLSDQGLDALTSKLGLESWCFEMAGPLMNPRNLLILDRYLSCPYYLRRRKQNYQLLLLGDQESTVASLYGDIQRFISSLEP